jgi:hypothetical protein
MKHKKITTRSLTDPKSGLTTTQIDYLSVTSPQFCQKGDTLYITGGYGVDSQTTTFGTKPIISIIDLKGLIKWVEHPESDRIAEHYIKQLSDPIFQITGGRMSIIKDNFLLVFGQNFEGAYNDSNPPTFVQTYSEQVRRFELKKSDHKYKVENVSYYPTLKDPNYRRRDLPILSQITADKKGHLSESLVAYSGVFTPNNGIWTVPVEISNKGKTKMADPNNALTFKQGMNNYACASIAMYSIKRKEMYTLFLGGITFEYIQNGVVLSDSEIPFTNQCTTIKINSHGEYSQYLMDGTYPVILSTTQNVGNPLLFGAGAEFIIKHDIKTIHDNGRVVDYDKLPHGSVTIGYIVGGIQSTVPNTSTRADSSASNHIFNVTINK